MIIIEIWLSSTQYLFAILLAILRILLRDETQAEDVNIDDLAQKTDGFSGSDLKRERFFFLPSRVCVLMRVHRSLCLCSSGFYQAKCCAPVEV